MKKLLFLFAVLLGTVGAWAQQQFGLVSKPSITLNDATAIDVNEYYILQTADEWKMNLFLKDEGQMKVDNQLKVYDATVQKYLWQIIKDETTGTYSFKNVATGKFFPVLQHNNTPTTVEEGSAGKFTLIDQGSTAAGVWNIKNNGDDVCLNVSGSNGFTSANTVGWNTQGGNSNYKIYVAETTDLSALSQYDITFKYYEGETLLDTKVVTHYSGRNLSISDVPALDFFDLAFETEGDHLAEENAEFNISCTPNFPFEPATINASGCVEGKWYKLTQGSYKIAYTYNGNGQVRSGSDDDTHRVDFVDDNSNAKGYWAFVRVPGTIKFNVYNLGRPGVPMAAVKHASQTNKDNYNWGMLYMDYKQGSITDFVISKNGSNFNIQIPAERINNNSATCGDHISGTDIDGHHFGFWSDGRSGPITASNSRLAVEEVSIAELDIAISNAKTDFKKALWGDEFPYVNSSYDGTYINSFEDLDAVLEAATSVDDLNATKRELLDNSQYYIRMYNAGRYKQHTQKWYVSGSKVVENGNENSLFAFNPITGIMKQSATGQYLVRGIQAGDCNYANSKYSLTNDINSASSFKFIGSNREGLTDAWFVYEGVGYMCDWGGNRSNYVFSLGNSNDNWATWAVEIKNCTLKYSYVYDNKEYLTQEVKTYVGAEFPELSVTLPYGVSMADVKPDGTISDDDVDDGMVTKVIGLNIDLPFEISSDYGSATWYFMCLKPSEKWYLGYALNQTSIPLSETQKTLPSEGLDAYKWAFVGNPFDGYKIMNKLAGENMILSSTTTMSSGTGNASEGGTTHPLMIAESSLPEVNNTLWIPTASTHAAKGFYLAQKGHPTNRMNARDGKLAYWTGGADAGSTFLVSTLANWDDYENVISTLLSNAGQVGYPKLNNTAYSALQRVSSLSGRATVLDVETAISAYKTTTDICLPVDGEAYQFAFVANNSDRTEYNIHVDGTNLTAGEDNTPSTFYCRKFTNSNGEERYAFISEDGNLLKFQGLTTSYTTHSGSDTRLCNDFVVSAMTGVNANVTSAREDRYGTVYLATDDRENDETVGCFVYKFTQTAGMNGASAPFHDGDYTSAIKVTKVMEYTPSAEVSQVASTIDPLAKGYKRVGEGLGKYTYTFGENTGTVFTDFETLIKTANELIEPSDYSFAINMPEAGFYRFKAYNTSKYLQNYSINNNFQLNADKDVRSIMYLGAKKTILSYGSGQYANDHTNPVEIGTDALSWSIVENASVVGHYALDMANHGYLDIHSSWVASSGNNNAGSAWIIEPVKALPFTFKKAALGFATFNAPVAVELPEGVLAYITDMVEEENVLQMYRLEGNVVPANTPVMLYNKAAKADGAADERTIPLKIVDAYTGDEFDKFDGENDFVGTVAAITYPTTGETVYSLQKKQKEQDSDPDMVGFYKKASVISTTTDEGTTTTPSTLAGFKAWIITATSNARAFTIIFDGDDATGLKEALGLENENVEIYDLSGRRLDKPAKGVNVIGGKLVIK